MPLQGGSSTIAIGRLHPGVTVEAASAEMAAVVDGLAREFPNSNAGRGATLERMLDAVIGSDLRQTSILFLGVVGCVLLMCCANVANLLLTRATARKAELALRAALGANVLSLLGGALGLLLGAAVLSMAPSAIPQGLLPPSMTLARDGRVIAFGAAAALVGLLFGLLPAWQATRFSPAHVIASDSRTVTGRGGRTRAILAAGQVATAVVLLFGAGLLLRTLLALENVDRGYRAESVLTMIVDPDPASLPRSPCAAFTMLPPARSAPFPEFGA